MKTNFERRCHAQRESAEALIKAEFGDTAADLVFSFSALECVIDFRVGKSYVRYVLIENDDEPNKLRRIG